MSTTKRLLVKAEKPQDQTCASQAQALIDHILEEKTTGLSDAIDSAVYSSIMHGTGSVKLDGYTIGLSNTTATQISASNPSYPYLRPTELKREMLDTHPAFELTTEQLRASWMLTYGNRWVDIQEARSDDYMSVVALRLKALGELEVHNTVDQYSAVGRLKV